MRRYLDKTQTLSSDRSTLQKLYDLKVWHDLKLKCHVRDNYICQMCGELCTGKGKQKNAPVADHIKPHKGNMELFLDLENLQTLCTYPCHNKHKKKMEMSTKPQIGEDGWPIEERT